MRALLAEAPRGRAAARRRSRFAPLVLGVLAGCAELQTLENEVCGNGVIEQGEDCDFAEPGCRRPPAAGACRYECAHPSSGVKGPSCPEGFGCGVDNTCRRPAGSFSRTTERLAEAASALRVADFDGDGRDDVLTLGAPNDRGERAARVVFRDEGGFGVTTRVPNVFRSVAIGAFGDGPARGMAMVSNQGSLAGLNLLVGGPARGFASLVNPALGGANAALPASMRIIGVDALPRRAATGEGGATIEFNQGDEVVLLQP
ncbi:MAG: hypothetical protein MUF34_28320, partial [Polyangiaceae bacterium]|nr:hypothetical protein [Polyangiaceae bacterium]